MEVFRPQTGGWEETAVSVQSAVLFRPGTHLMFERKVVEGSHVSTFHILSTEADF